MEEALRFLQQLPSITLEEMKRVQLMNRIDVKYLCNFTQFTEIAPCLKENYYVQTIDEEIVAPYQTLYFDTPDISMYVAHHNRKLCRQKIRTRRYRNSQTTFCEIKNKNNKGRTNKLRIPITPDKFESALDDIVVQNFVRNNLQYELSLLIPQIENSFKRITLVNIQKNERITIDYYLEFYNHSTGASAKTDNLVIIEVKQDGRAASFFKELLHLHHIQPKRISKYCLGTVLTNLSAKKNRFKRRLYYIEKITGVNYSNSIFN